MEGDSSHKKFLVIQTASIGDVILATSVIEKIHHEFPESAIDFLLKKGNESLFKGHPFLNKVMIWDKGSGKYRNLFRILSEVRKERYEAIVDLHRFASSGLIAGFGKAKGSYGFRQNPLSFLFTQRVPHVIGGPQGLHEIIRNQQLLENFCPGQAERPKLYPSAEDFRHIADYQSSPYITIAPMSLWYTKQYPIEKWIEFIRALPADLRIYLTGAGSDKAQLDIISESVGHTTVINLASKLSLLQTAALMKGALMNYTNDSAPLHLASAMNAPLTAVFCSTVPAFGFGPLSDDAVVIETEEKLSCRPCGLHGYTTCPQQHFACAYGIPITKLTGRINYEK